MKDVTASHVAHHRTVHLARRVGENVAMGTLLVVSRGLVSACRVQRALQWTEQVSNAVRWTSPLRRAGDTIPRARALAYRWSRWVPGANCLHRALATRLWLAAYRIDASVVVGFRKRDRFEGHAWLEIPLEDAVTLMFVSDDDGYDAILAEGMR